MSRGLASLRGYQEGGPPKGLPQELKSRLQSRLTSGEEMIREVQRKLAEMDNFYNKAENYNFNLWADTRNKEFEEREERELEELRVRMMEEPPPFLDSLQAIVKSPDLGWEKDVPIRVGWNFLEKLIEQGTNPIRHTIAKYRPSKFGIKGLGEEIVFRDEPYTYPGAPPRGVNTRGIAAHEFGHAADYRNIFPEDVEKKAIEEWRDLPEQERHGLDKALYGDTQSFADAFGEAVRHLQVAKDPMHEGRIPERVLTLVEELLKLPIYENHPFNVEGFSVAPHSDYGDEGLATRYWGWGR